jgi:alpha-L-fucosidase
MMMYGEAMRGVRPWTVTNEGDVWLTRSKGEGPATLYAITDFDYDAEGTTWRQFSGGRLTLRSVLAMEETEVSILGQEGGCSWHQDDDGLHITAFNLHTVQFIAYPGSMGPDWPVALKITGVMPKEGITRER